MEYHCISADGHIDLNWMPHDLFVSNATQAMKDRVPYVSHGPEGAKWVTKSGVELGFANAKGAAPKRRHEAVPAAGQEYRHDRIASTGLFTDSTQGIFRPTTPELRLKDQDRDGIQAEVMYGLHSMGWRMTDHEATVEFYRIYNDWLTSFCGYDRKRLVGLASIPSRNVDDAVAETHRVAKLGLGGLDFLASWEMIPLWNPYWDPFWKAAADVNLAVHFHVIGLPPAPPIPDDLPASAKMAHKATRMAAGPQAMVTILGSVIHGGALEKYPNLRIVLGESGIGWIPSALEKMDDEYENRWKRGLGLKMKPSEYWRRQCRATFQQDYVGVNNLLDVLGVETVMWASDYPHGDSTYPDSQEYIKRQFSHLPGATQRKITCENAGKFYGLIPA